MGIIGLMTSIAHDMARYTVRSNCIGPWAWSRLSDSVPAARAERERMKKLATDRIAPMVVYLMSDASRSVSG